MPKKRFNIWDLLTYVAFGIVVLYSFLKVLGYIKSPITLDIAFLSSAFFILGRYAMRIDYIAKATSNLNKKVSILDKRVSNLEQKVERIE